MISPPVAPGQCCGGGAVAVWQAVRPRGWGGCFLPCCCEGCLCHMRPGPPSSDARPNDAARREYHTAGRVGLVLRLWLLLLCLRHISVERAVCARVIACWAGVNILGVCSMGAIPEGGGVPPGSFAIPAALIQTNWVQGALLYIPDRLKAGRGARSLPSSTFRP